MVGLHLRTTDSGQKERERVTTGPSISLISSSKLIPSLLLSLFRSDLSLHWTKEREREREREGGAEAEAERIYFSPNIGNPLKWLDVPLLPSSTTEYRGMILSQMFGEREHTLFLSLANMHTHTHSFSLSLTLHAHTVILIPSHSLNTQTYKQRKDTKIKKTTFDSLK